MDSLVVNRYEPPINHHPSPHQRRIAVHPLGPVLHFALLTHEHQAPCSKPRRQRPRGAALCRTTKTLKWGDLDNDQTSSPLSTSLLRESIFPFLAPLPGDASLKLENFRAHEFKCELAPLRLVCKHWYKLGHWFATEAEKQVLKVDKTKDLARLTKRLKHNGEAIVQLQVRVFKDPVGSCVWLGFFHCVRNIVQLSVDTNVAEFPKLLCAASQVCPQVKVLIFHPDGNPFDCTALLDALRAWLKSDGGHRSLAIPQSLMYTSDFGTFVTHVAEMCPQLERLRFGLRTSIAAYVPAPVWATVRSMCPKLEMYLD